MIGETILHYKILAKLGEGGMGEVYLAEDTKLERKVALKFLPRHLSTDPKLQARFQREAKAAAALNHPNIITVYEIGEHEGRAYIAMEYIEGYSLRELISESELPEDRIIDILLQICAGLNKAHQAGIVHRDLKPENIMIDADGKVRILDFGLAKLQSKSKLSFTKFTMGTISYMAPEQCEGGEIDHRADIWAVGVMLYEMVAGKRPFDGEHEAAIIYAIISQEPKPIDQHVSTVLKRVIDKALAKDVKARYQHLDEMLADFKGKQESKSIWPKPTAVKANKPRRVMLLAFVLTALAILGAYIAIKVFGNQPAVRLTPRHAQLTFNGNVYLNTSIKYVDASALSPDGQFLAYVLPRDRTKVLFVQDLSGGQPLEIVSGIKFLASLRWSPDGTEIMFWDSLNDSLNGNFVFPRLGGKPRTLRPLPFSCWSPDGSQIAGAAMSAKFITIINMTTGEIASKIQWLGGMAFRDIDWSPLGDRLLFLSTDRPGSKYTIWTIKLDGTQQQKVVEEDGVSLYSPRWSIDGNAIYYLRSTGLTRDLMKIKVDRANGTAKSEPVALLTGLHAYGFTLSRNNKKLSYTQYLPFSNLWLVNLDAKDDTHSIKTKKLTNGTSSFSWPGISPDGQKLAFSHRRNIFVSLIHGGEMEQLTFLDAVCRRPQWSPDGKAIAFNAKGKIWRVPSAGGTPRMFKATEASADLAWAPGKEIIYQRTENQNLHILDPQTENEKPLLAKKDQIGWIFQPSVSPDGKKLAVYWNRREGGVWLISFADASQTLLYKGWCFPIQWSADGKWIYAWNASKKPARILMIPENGGEPKSVGTVPFENIDSGDMALTPDGKYIICSVQESISDVWLLENFDPEVE